MIVIVLGIADGGFIYEIYNRNNEKWVVDESQCAKKPMWPQTTTPSMNTHTFVSQTQTLVPSKNFNQRTHSCQPNSIFQSLTNSSATPATNHSTQIHLSAAKDQSYNN